ncbi:MAG TPA: endonuclease III domain-containing protein [Burkholderiales bacterium]|nr:endonuclease III domain-containing protein [Burkholderiales bacterium]
MRGARDAKKKPTAGRRKSSAARTIYHDVYRKLRTAHGPQHWWPGDSAFEIMVGAVLTQNTAWTNVEKAIVNLKNAKALTPEAIVKAPHRQLAGWLKPSGYFNIKAKRLKAMCRWLIVQGGVRKLAKFSTHDLRAALIAVYGIGPETADDIVLYAFNRPVFVIDAYTRRIFARLGLIKGEEGYETLRHLFEHALKPGASLFNEYHALIVKHGKDICRARPWCTACCLRPVCPSGR